MLIQIIKQRAKLGEFIVVTLKTGKEVGGALVEVGEEYVILSSTEGEEFLRESEIAHFKRSRVGPPSTEASAPNSNTNNLPQDTSLIKQASISDSRPSHNNTDLIPQVSIPSSLQSTPLSPNVYSIELLTAVIETQARYQTAIRQVELPLLPADFSFNADEFKGLSLHKRENIRSEWVKIQNSYNHAVRIRELSRFHQLADRLILFIQRNPSTKQAFFNLGCLYFDINRIPDAARWFASAASIFDHCDAWYNLSVVLLGRAERGSACYALHRYFHQTLPSHNLSAWYRCVELTLEHNALVFVKELLVRVVREQRSDDIHIITDSLIYILRSLGRHDDALALAAYLQNRKSVSLDLAELLAKIIDGLGLIPERAYVNAEAVIREMSNYSLPAPEKATPVAAPIKQVVPIQSLSNTTRPARSSTSGANKSKSLPSGRTPYARAKYVQLELGDFREAERLFLQAIRESDNTESAVKDLASLLRQQNRTSEAIKLLTDYVERASDKISILNLLADMYQHNGRYADAIDILRKIVDNVPNQRRINPQKRIAYCYFKIDEFDRAENVLNQVLQISPNDSTTLRWLKGLQEAKRSGLYANLDAIFTVQSQLMDFASSISKFLEFFLERCSYQGVPEGQVRSRTFSEADLRKLDGLIEGAGRRRPGLRAQYHLSAARLYLDLNLEDESQIRTSLQNFAGDMGDASLLEQRPLDVVMAFYLESFAIAPKWTGRLRDRLTQFIMLFYTSREEITSEKVSAPEYALSQALQNGQRTQTIVESLLELSLLNRQVAEVLLPKIALTPRISTQVATQCFDIIGEKHEQVVSSLEELLPIWERGREFCRRRNQEVADEFAFLHTLLQSQATVLDTIGELSNAARHCTRDGRPKCTRERRPKCTRLGNPTLQER